MTRTECERISVFLDKVSTNFGRNTPSGLLARAHALTLRDHCEIITTPDTIAMLMEAAAAPSPDVRIAYENLLQVITRERITRFYPD
jgi:hypothetical protein